jgi:hypothetical protein
MVERRKRVKLKDQPFLVGGGLTQIGIPIKVGDGPRQRKYRGHVAVFRCSCGKSHISEIAQVAAGRVKSCGCSIAAGSPTRSRKHGKTGSSVHNIWRGMIARCGNKSNCEYKNYGGRGITVCDEWHEFAVFYSDIGDPPPKTSIDRIDNEKGYSKENCRWATNAQQARNKRTNINVTIDGVEKCATDWANENGVSPITAIMRIHMGVDPKVAVTAKPRRGKWNLDR